jgi:hypothetical protein
MTEKPVKYVAKTTPATYRHARFGAPDACLAQLRRAGLDHPSLAESGWTPATAHERHVARTFALSYERLAPWDPHRRPGPGPGPAGPQCLLCPRRAHLLVKQEAKRC